MQNVSGVAAPASSLPAHVESTYGDLTDAEPIEVGVSQLPQQRRFLPSQKSPENDDVDIRVPRLTMNNLEAVA